MRHQKTFSIIEIKTVPGNSLSARYYLTFFRSNEVKQDGALEVFFQKRRPEADCIYHMMITTPWGKAKLYFMDDARVERGNWDITERSIPFLTALGNVLVFLDCVWIIPLYLDEPVWIRKKQIPDYVNELPFPMGMRNELFFKESIPKVFPQNRYTPCDGIRFDGSRFAAGPKFTEVFVWMTAHVLPYTSILSELLGRAIAIVCLFNKKKVPMVQIKWLEKVVNEEDLQRLYSRQKVRALLQRIHHVIRMVFFLFARITICYSGAILPEDDTIEHVLFSNPGMIKEAICRGMSAGNDAAFGNKMLSQRRELSFLHREFRYFENVVCKYSRAKTLLRMPYEFARQYFEAPDDSVKTKALIRRTERALLPLTKVNRMMDSGFLCSGSVIFQNMYEKM